MKSIVLLLTFIILPITAFSGVSTSLAGKVFIGDEYFNNQMTGKKCFVTISQINLLESKGKGCQSINAMARFSTETERLLDSSITLFSRITNTEANFHGPKTCEGEAPFFSNQFKGVKEELHYFLSFSNDSTPYLFKVHGVNWFKETDWDCTNLIKLQ